MKVVILRALYLGDFLTAVPAFRAIRRAFSGASVVLAAPGHFDVLCELLDGAIDEIAHAVELEPLPPRARDADVGIDLHGCGPASQRLLLAAGARRLIAFRRDEVPETYGGPAFDAGEHEVARWCRLLRAYGIPADPDQLDLRVPTAAVPDYARGATLVHCGAASEARRWPVERFVEVVRAERARGRRVVLTGNARERDRALAIARGADLPETYVFAGRTDLRELAALVAASARVLCGDTGVAHLATAFRRPSVVLFGPTPPATWGPPARPIHRVIWNGTTGDPHGDRVDRGLAAIDADRVIAELCALPA
jgi:ADP-heptose:LPS heptosyltransferase